MKTQNNDAEEEEVSGEAAYGQTTHLWSSVKVLSIIVGCASSFSVLLSLIKTDAAPFSLSSL